MATCGDPRAYTPPPSLWSLVEQNVSPGEQDEIKSMLGISLVETTLDLHNEVNMLLEIWQDYQEETDLEGDNKRTLAEPPHVRERLIQEICFLAESVREKSVTKGMNPSSVFSRHNSQILEYAEETQRSGSALDSQRPLSARSSDGRQTPLVPSENANSRFALSSTISKEVSSANKKLNYLQFDEVCNRLRETLTKEMEQLEADVVFLQSCLSDAADIRSNGGTPALTREPTITELQQERSLLEKDLLSTESIPRIPSVNKPHFDPGPTASGIKIHSLGPINPNRRPVTNTDSGKEASKSMPLKASHAIALTQPSHQPVSTDVAHTRSSSSDSPNNPKPSTAEFYDSCTQGKSSVQGQMSDQRGYQKTTESNYRMKREISGIDRRLHSPTRVKVVPVGSILEPRIDSAGSRSLMPTPPPTEETPPLSRPNSAQRFRKMVMQCREST